MKAAVLTNVQCPVEIKTLELPRPSRGQVVVKVKYAGLCRSQLMEVEGARGEDKYLPHLLGHEGVGTIHSVGDGVTKVTIGDRVILGWIKGDGAESTGTTYKSIDGKTINAGQITTFSDYTVVSENRVTICPPNVSDEIAVLFGCALPTGAGMVLNQLQPPESATVLVMGLGGVGLSALLALHHFNIRTIIAMDIEGNKLQLAKELGATHTFLSTEEGMGEFYQAFPEGVDFAIESAGLCKTIERAFDCLNQTGLCLFASHPPSGEKIQLDPHDLISGKRIQGSWGGASQPDKDIPIIAEIINRYHLPVEKLLSGNYSLQQINKALDDLKSRKITRALIDMSL